MGGGNLSPIVLVIVFLPHILVGIAFLFGVFLLTRETRSVKIVGGGIMALTVFGVFGLPVLNSVQQDIKRNGFFDDALLPDTILMRDATVLVVGVSPECDLFCPKMLGEFAKRIIEVVPQDDEYDIYRAGPFDLTSLSGRFWDGEYVSFESEVAGDDVDYVLFTENHWLAYHHRDSVLQFPEEAYAGFFLYKVEDARAFDIAAIEPVLRIYQSPQMPSRYLWFTGYSNVITVPSNEEIAEAILSRLRR